MVNVGFLNNFIDFNRYNGRKKYIKMSAMTDSYGIPLGIAIVPGNKSDVITVKETIDKIPINLNTKRNRYKQNFLADAGYSSRKNKILFRHSACLCLWI